MTNTNVYPHSEPQTCNNFFHYWIYTAAISRLELSHQNRSHLKSANVIEVAHFFGTATRLSPKDVNEDPSRKIPKERKKRKADGESTRPLQHRSPEDKNPREDRKKSG